MFEQKAMIDPDVTKNYPRNMGRDGADCWGGGTARDRKNVVPSISDLYQLLANGLSIFFPVFIA